MLQIRIINVDRFRQLVLGLLCCFLLGEALAADGVPEAIIGDPYIVSGDPNLSGDGKWIVFTQNNQLVVVQNLESGIQTILDVQTVFNSPDLQLPNDVYPVLNQDGSVIALFGSTLDGSTSRASYTLLVMNRSGTELARLTALDYYSDPATFEDLLHIDNSGQYVVVGSGNYLRSVRSVTPGGNDVLNLSADTEQAFRLNVQTGAIDLLAVNSIGGEVNDNVSVLGVSSGGRYVFFVSASSNLPGYNGEAQIYRRDMSAPPASSTILISLDDTGNALNRLDQYCGFNCLSQATSDDGSRAVYSGWKGAEADSKTWLWVEGLGASEVTQITPADPDETSISGDGQWLSVEGEYFSRLNLDTGETDDVLTISDPDLNQDGSLLLFYTQGLTHPDTGGGGYWLLPFSDVPPPPDTDPPTWPGGSLTATVVGDNAVDLSWSEAVDDSGIKQYVLYRDENEIIRQTGQTFRDSPLAPGTYDYRVEAVDNFDNLSGNGPTAFVQVLPPAQIVVEVNEQIRVNDQLQVTPPLIISIDESIKVKDEQLVLSPIIISIEENIQVSDTPLVLPPLLIIVTESIAVVDSIEFTAGPTLADVIRLTFPPGPILPGTTFIAEAGGFKPFTPVQAFLRSEPVLVGTEQADADGNVRFLITIPMGFAPGEHTLILIGEAPDGSIRQLSAPITIDALYIPVPVNAPWALIAMILMMLASTRHSMRRRAK